jgi:hypothetical protein
MEDTLFLQHVCSTLNYLFPVAVFLAPEITEALHAPVKQRSDSGARLTGTESVAKCPYGMRSLLLDGLGPKHLLIHSSRKVMSVTGT